MRIKYHQASKLLIKLGFKPPRMSHHKQYVLEYNGQIIIRAYYSHGSVRYAQPQTVRYAHRRLRLTGASLVFGEI